MNVQVKHLFILVYIQIGGCFYVIIRCFKGICFFVNMICMYKEQCNTTIQCLKSVIDLYGLKTFLFSPSTYDFNNISIFS
ncbi:MAG: hypothetical protein PWP27_1006 [Clostridiales bacterium]|jgi:hypothetical protein|nr:hypothetical protein [Clostridiales bacterium]MDK2933196.1 hypothetical protein [Clostridiales bacterium]